jgi:hydrogenase maturation protease
MKIAVVGVGNILLKDEGIGVKVVKELEKEYTFPPEITLIDGGTAGHHLVNVVADFDVIIVIDAVQGGESPGTIYRFTLDQIPFELKTHLSVHQVGVLEALNQVKLLGKKHKVTFIGIEPQDISPWSMELTPVIEEKIPRLISLVLEELEKCGIPRNRVVSKSKHHE